MTAVLQVEYFYLNNLKHKIKYFEFIFQMKYLLTVGKKQEINNILFSCEIQRLHVSIFKNKLMRLMH